MILCDNNVFYLDCHKHSDCPQTINYRCLNYRKDRRNRTTQFYNVLLKRKEEGKIIYYKLEKNHFIESKELNTENKKIETNIMENYNDYFNKCFNYLDSTEEYKKKILILNCRIYSLKINIISN